jgi:hypothetical protein
VARVWRGTWASGVFVCAVLAQALGTGGCSSDDPGGDEVDGGGAASGGTSGTAGRGGGTPTGGSAGSSGSAGRGGSSGSAGLGGTAGASGTSSGGTGGAGPDCTHEFNDDSCTACTKSQCCFEFLACGREPLCNGEVRCIHSCVNGAVNDGGVADAQTISTCATQCKVGGTITPATNDLIGCQVNGALADGGTGIDCFAQCFQGS